jgi:endoglucanase
MMIFKTLVVLLIFTSILSAQAQTDDRSMTRAKHSDDVKVSQVGYLPQASKLAMLTTVASGDVSVRRSSDNAVVLTVQPGAAAADASSGDSIRIIDFSKLTTSGTYYLDVPGVGASYDFRIADDVFAHSFRLAMRFYTGQRCGIDVSLAPDFPEFHHPACHTDDADFDPSSGKSGKKSATGGWHDAGDYGRYVVNSGITCGTLLWAFELNPDKLRSIRLDIPESGGKVPDVLAEIAWNIKWMLKMQDDDGGVWHKETSGHFCHFIMPQDDHLPELIIGSGEAPYKTTAATADFAAVCAIAGRVYRPFDPQFADTCLSAAERAWTWVAANPSHDFQKNPQGITTGAYSDKDSSDECLWAAAELFRTTGKDAYNQYFLTHYTHWNPTLSGDAPQAWGDVHNLAMYAYAQTTQPNVDENAVKKIRSDAIAAADAIVHRSEQDGYRIALLASDYKWGSNSTVGNYAMMVLMANRFEPKPQYVECAQNSLHYLLGRNTFNSSFVTQLGSKWPLHPHHRTSAADGIDQPWPGMLVGGPNAMQRRAPTTASTTAPALQNFANVPPAKAWVDDQRNFTVNEVAINWNAPLVFVLADSLR